jgi:ribosome biogenesis protein UTP30
MFLPNLSATFPNAAYRSIKVGKMSQKPSQIAENIITAIPAIAKAIPGGWDNIQSLHIKTNSSVSLPIWSCVLEDTEAGAWGGIGLQGGSATRENEKDEGDRDDAAGTTKKSKKSKSRKRSPISDDEAEEEAPRKKAKPIDQTGKTKDKPKADNHTGPEAVLSPKSQKPKKPSNATKLGDSISVKKDKAKILTSVTTLSPPRAIDHPRKKDQKTSVPPNSPASKSTTPQAEADGKRKESKGPVAKPNLTKEETKTKYPSASFDKKKRNITKAKGGKSVKNAFLGKKVAQG